MLGGGYARYIACIIYRTYLYIFRKMDDSRLFSFRFIVGGHSLEARLYWRTLERLKWPEMAVCLCACTFTTVLASSRAPEMAVCLCACTFIVAAFKACVRIPHSSTSPPNTNTMHSSNQTAIILNGCWTTYIGKAHKMHC